MQRHIYPWDFFELHLKWIVCFDIIFISFRKIVNHIVEPTYMSTGEGCNNMEEKWTCEICGDEIDFDEDEGHELADGRHVCSSCFNNFWILRN